MGPEELYEKFGQFPLPGLGHWTKIACGHTIRVLLSPSQENLPILIRHDREPYASLQKTLLESEGIPIIEIAHQPGKASLDSASKVSGARKFRRLAVHRASVK